MTFKMTLIFPVMPIYYLLMQMDSLAEFWRQKHPCAVIQRPVPPGAKPCLQYIHARLLQQDTHWLMHESGSHRPVVDEPAKLQHFVLEMTTAKEAERQGQKEYRRASSAHRVQCPSKHT